MPTERTGKRVAANEEWVQVRIPKPAKDRLDAWAARKGLSASFVMRRLLLRALDANEDEGEVP